MNDFIQTTFSNLIKNRKTMLMFHLLKYLNHLDLIKLKLVSKSTNNLCDANISQDKFN